MATIPLALRDSEYGQALLQRLTRDKAFQSCHVDLVSVPQPHNADLLVVDCATLDQMSLPRPYPERIVLISKNDPEELSRAWGAGILSVIFEQDPLTTVVLAILAAQYRAVRSIV